MGLSIMKGASIMSTGSSTPHTRISNHDLSKIVDTSDEWISHRTGIQERRVIKPSESIIDLAFFASQEALQKAKIDPNELNLIILATSSPNDLFGSATQLQARLGASQAVAFDITAACSGFVMGLITASQFIRTGAYQTVLVVGADILSHWVDWTDRTSCILFGDGAGAAIVQSSSNNNILGFQLNSDGRYANQLSIAYQPKQTPILKNQSTKYDYIYMNGKEIYKFAVSKVPESIKECLDNSNLSINEIQWLLLHQANQRIIDAVAKKLDIPQHKIISNLQNYGNTSAASIPIALNEFLQENKIRNGDLIIIAGFGAGLTWGTMIIKWYNIV